MVNFSPELSFKLTAGVGGTKTAVSCGTKAVSDMFVFTFKKGRYQPFEGKYLLTALVECFQTKYLYEFWLLFPQQWRFGATGLACIVKHLYYFSQICVNANHFDNIVVCM